MANEVSLEGKVFDVPPSFQQHAWISSMDQYNEMYRRSLEDSDAFWAEVAERITWFKKWDSVQNHDFANAKIQWFEGGKLNLSYNCLDRHMETDVADKVAFYWEGDSPDVSRTITYRQLWEDVTQVRERPPQEGREEGRPGHHLPADDPRTAGGHVGLRPHRSHPQRGVRRLLRRRAARPHPRLRIHYHDHRRRRTARLARASP